MLDAVLQLIKVANPDLLGSGLTQLVRSTQDRCIQRLHQPESRNLGGGINENSSRVFHQDLYGLS